MTEAQSYHLVGDKADNSFPYVSVPERQTRFLRNLVRADILREGLVIWGPNYFHF